MANELGRGDSPPRPTHQLDTTGERNPTPESTIKSPEEIQTWLKERRDKWNFRGNEQRMDDESRRLYQLLEQEGFVENDPDALKFVDVAMYVNYGSIPEDTDLARSMANILERDMKGEWIQTAVVEGKTILKMFRD